MLCFSCQKEVKLVDGKAGFRDDCPSCRNDVHVCKNCDFYDPRSYNECREPQADRVTEKERANYCEYFIPSGNAGKAGKDKDDLKAAAEALFKKK